MRQLTCIGPGKIEWQDVPEPRLGGDLEALVRPLAVARCDIDRLLIDGVVPQRGPFALGHESVVEIVALGERVRGLALGQRAVVSFQISCGACAACLAGRTANCDRYPALSDYGMQPLSGVEYGGMLSDLVRVPHARAMLQPISARADAVALASVSDNVLDGYRAVAPHLRERPASDVLIVHHGASSIALYAAQAALALGAARVDFASADDETLALAERLGAHALKTDFGRRLRRYPIVVDSGNRPEALDFALRCTEPEGICQSLSLYLAPVPLPLVRMYTHGVRFCIGRCNAAALLPEVLPLIESGRLTPGDVTTKIVAWDDAAEAFAEPAIKLVVRR
ncbi:MAG: alcohol dehydrogenase catalytic domain-containing protein [bacterium]